MRTTQEDFFSLVEVSGAFLSPSVIKEVFPQGVPCVETEVLAKLRIAHSSFLNNIKEAAAQKTWIEEVFSELLNFSECIKEGQALPPGLEAAFPEHSEVLRPDYAVVNPAGTADAGKVRLLISKYPADQKLGSAISGKYWKASPAFRMMELLHKCELKLGLVTNGPEWMLVYAPLDEVSGYATWDSSIFFEEPVTLNAFSALLGANRFFAVSTEDALESLYDRSAQYQQDVTDQLGKQVLSAVEVLIQSFDKIDADSGRERLSGVSEKEMYDSALVVMMRLVFLLAAEERGLLHLGEEIYDDNYAVSTLRDQLRETADQYGEEILERNIDGWARLLAVFRAIYSGINHESLRLPAYGGSLFCPDKYPFLEGRKPGTSWKTANPNPLPVNNRVVLHLLEALQFVRTNSGRGPKETRRLSFRGLDVEQIGHIYEGLLDHTAARADSPIIGLKPAKDKVGLVHLFELEKFARDNSLTVEFIREATGKSESAINNALKPDAQYPHLDKLRASCGNVEELYKRVLPYSGLLDEDSFGYPVVMSKSAIYVTSGSDRRSTGTHYTPRTLTEPLVQHALDPLLYNGVAEGLPKEKWVLKTPAEILSLKICDPAMGSGAFLVQACRHMGERLIEAWDRIEKENGGIHITPEGKLSSANPSERYIPQEPDERITIARRIIADRCLYGIDKNPLAVEMAKLSMWLVTIQRARPFSFLDHALKCGDTLLGISNINQLGNFSLDPSHKQPTIATVDLVKHIEELSAKHTELESISSDAFAGIQQKTDIYAGIEEKTCRLRAAADTLISLELANANGYTRETVAAEMQKIWETKPVSEFLSWAAARLKGNTTFHWPLEFPEVFAGGGFDAFIGNPPFMGGQKISGEVGTDYRGYLVSHIAGGQAGSADLCSYFFLRCGNLLKPKGNFGLIATNTIAQGDTRTVGLARLIAAGFSIYRGIQSRKWPLKSASLEVAHVWGHKGAWKGGYVLEDNPVQGITEFLLKPGSVQGIPYRLKANESKAFQGSIVLGMGFILEPSEAAVLIEKDSKNKQVIFPYLNGDDLNSRPDQSASRFVIDFGERSEDEAKAFIDCYAILKERVFPERSKKDPKKYPRMVNEWWKFWCARPELYSSIAGLNRVIVAAQTTKYLSVNFSHTNTVWSHTVVVFALDKYCDFAVLNSSFHSYWILAYCSRLENRMRYIPTDGFANFPFPGSTENLEDVGTLYHETRQSIMAKHNLGLTALYNRFHNSKDATEDIIKLRDIHRLLDRTIATCYGWKDLPLEYDFHQTKEGMRYTLPEGTRLEVLDRLLKLNHERHDAEEKSGLYKKKASKKKPAVSDTNLQFDFGDNK